MSAPVSRLMNSLSSLAALSACNATSPAQSGEPGLASISASRWWKRWAAESGLKAAAWPERAAASALPSRQVFAKKLFLPEMPDPAAFLHDTAQFVCWRVAAHDVEGAARPGILQRRV